MSEPRKYKSGAQKRAEKRDRERAMAAGAARELGLEVRDPDAPPPPAASPADTGADAFAVLGDPDLSSPDLALDYVRRAQLIAFGQIVRSPAVGMKERWKLIREHSAVLGMTHPRAALESRLKKLEGTAPKKARATAAKVEPAHGVARPETARGRGGRRGPRPLPGPGDGPAEGEDE